MAILAFPHFMKSICYKHQIHRFRVFRQSLRVSQVDLDCRYPKYHNFYNRSIFSEQVGAIASFTTVSKPVVNIADITCFGGPCEPQHIVVFYLTLAAYCDVNQLNGLAISV